MIYCLVILKTIWLNLNNILVSQYGLPGDIALGGESGTDTGWYVPLTGKAVFCKTEIRSNDLLFTYSFL